jgi:predicted transcriptional regulator
MNKVTISVESRDAAIARIVAAANSGKEAQTAHITFDTPEALFGTFTQMRIQIVREMTGSGPMSIRELARRVGRDVKRVHEDVHALLNVGVLDRTESGAIEFPYDAVHFDFSFDGQKAA